LIDGARQRMRQVGMSEAQIAVVENVPASTQPRIDHLRADRRRGHRADGARGHDGDVGRDAVQASTAFPPCGPTPKCPKSQAALLRARRDGAGRSPAAPGVVTFEGRVQAILPEVNADHTHAQGPARTEQPAGSRSCPACSCRCSSWTRVLDKVADPDRGRDPDRPRTVVMLAEDNGKFKSGGDSDRGSRSGGQTEIKRGLQVGQRVVVSSQFLIDSEASLKGVEARLNVEPKPDAANTAPRHHGEAKVESDRARCALRCRTARSHP
jgi:Cu(I)/Ag(I) efflux system membrane fusion protein